MEGEAAAGVCERYRSNRCAVQPAPSGCWKLTHPLHCLIPLNPLKGFWSGNGQVSVCAQALLQLLRCTACMAAARVATMLCLLLVYVPCNDLCCILPTHSTSTFCPPTVPHRSLDGSATGEQAA